MAINRTNLRAHQDQALRVANHLLMVSMYWQQRHGRVARDQRTCPQLGQGKRSTFGGVILYGFEHLGRD